MPCETRSGGTKKSFAGSPYVVFRFAECFGHDYGAGGPCAGQWRKECGTLILEREQLWPACATDHGTSTIRPSGPIDSHLWGNLRSSDPSNPGPENQYQVNVT